MSDDGEITGGEPPFRELLTTHGIEIPPDPPVLVEKVEVRRLSPEAKIRLFRELFRGRDDVFAVRWESPDGRKGYSPKSDRDWKAWYAARPEERQKVDRETRRHVPLTDEAIRAHLQSAITVGIYPLLRDERCWFLAADFDKASWEEDCRAFLESCSEWNIPAVLERSRSGKGGHIWIFFGNSIPALLARKLGCALLTRAMERRHQALPERRIWQRRDATGAPTQRLEWWGDVRSPLLVRDTSGPGRSAAQQAALRLTPRLARSARRRRSL